ncbi:MAG: DNA maturase B [Euryarchaeota archaeon]|mgnify:FL=1|nr:DNA maturase B [Euryarchaeota archaeon]
MLDPRLKDFRNFLFLVWDHLGLPEPTPVQYDIADYIQNGPKRRCVMAFRGVGKSWITSAFVVHQLLLDPTKNILVVSASKQRADDFSTFTLRLIDEMPLLQHLKPHDSQRNSKIAFDVGPAPAAHAPSVTSKGLTSQITGSRADLIIADDAESLTNSATQMMRDKMSEQVKEFDAVLKPGGSILYLGTPQTEASIYNQLPERGYAIRIWPARVPTEKQRLGYGQRLAPMIAQLDLLEGDPVDPKRFNTYDLLEREASYGKSGFALQFMLDTSLSDVDRYPLKLSDLVIMRLDREQAPEKILWAGSPEYAYKDLPCVGMAGDRFYMPMGVSGEFMNYQGAVLAVDPSGRGKDETAYAVVKMLNSQLFVTAAGGLPGGYDDDTLKSLAVIAKDQQVNEVIIESNFGDGMFTALFQPVLARIHKVSVKEVRHSVQKEKRILDVLEPVMNRHKLIVDEAVIQSDFNSTQHLPADKSLKYQLFYQMTRLTRDRGSLAHDDRLDVLAIAVNYWTEQMSRDVDDAMHYHKNEKLRKDLESFTDSVLGNRGNRGNTWISMTN